MVIRINTTFIYEGKRYRKGGFLTKREAKIAMTIKHSNLIDGFLS
ncbi:Arm DNA-binding domain-containing protein [Staphylococcus saccharolyticus]|nr:Arm DNA-binding domain-containing protein [Staphylococcus saccharolyticus]